MKWLRAYFKNPLSSILLITWLGSFGLHYLVMREFGISSALALEDALLSALLLLLLSLSSLLIHNFYQPGDRYWYYRLLFPLAGAALFVWLHHFIWMNLILLGREGPPMTEAIAFLRFVFVFFVLLITTLMAWFFYLMEVQRKQLNRKRESEKLVRESELMLIRRQLQPHFLFNSLNSISSLVKASPEKAREMIVKLSDLLRTSLKGQQKSLVSLEEELKYLELYIDMEKLRFGPNVQVIMEVEPGSGKSMLPGMILQPILENALKFSLKEKDKQSAVIFKARLNMSVLQLEFRNKVDEEEVVNSKGAGFGLEAVKRRLFLLYGRNDLFHSKLEDDTFIVELLIPQGRTDG